MPVCLSTIQVLRCEEAISDNLNDSFFFRDCTHFCYRGKHLKFVIASVLIFSLFLLVSIYLRPYWEKCQKSLSIKSSASYLSILSVSQLALALTKTNLEFYSERASGFSICIILIFQALLTSFSDPFNYKRLKVLQIIVLVLHLGFI